MNRRIILTDLKKIHLKDGDVFHCLKKGDNGYVNFGELYFSRVNFNKIKGWKRHRKITLNLVVPYGEVEFIFAHEDNKFRDNATNIIIKPGKNANHQAICK